MVKDLQSLLNCLHSSRPSDATPPPAAAGSRRSKTPRREPAPAPPPLGFRTRHRTPSSARSPHRPHPHRRPPWVPGEAALAHPLHLCTRPVQALQRPGRIARRRHQQLPLQQPGVSGARRHRPHGPGVGRPGDGGSHPPRGRARRDSSRPPCRGPGRHDRTPRARSRSPRRDARAPRRCPPGIPDHGSPPAACKQASTSSGLVVIASCRSSTRHSLRGRSAYTSMPRPSGSCQIDRLADEVIGHAGALADAGDGAGNARGPAGRAAGWRSDKAPGGHDGAPGGPGALAQLHQRRGSARDAEMHDPSVRSSGARPRTRWYHSRERARSATCSGPRPASRGGEAVARRGDAVGLGMAARAHRVPGRSAIPIKGICRPLPGPAQWLPQSSESGKLDSGRPRKAAREVHEHHGSEHSASPIATTRAARRAGAQDLRRTQAPTPRGHHPGGERHAI